MSIEFDIYKIFYFYIMNNELSENGFLLATFYIKWESTMTIILKIRYTKYYSVSGE